MPLCTFSLIPPRYGPESLFGANMAFECVLASTPSLSLPNPLLSIRFRASTVVGWLKEADGPAVRDSRRKERRINDSGVYPKCLAAGCSRTILPPHRTHVCCRGAVRRWDNLGHNEHTSRASGARIRAAHGTFSSPPTSTVF